MNNQTKRGFSLVEIMILFTVLAVAMAAALPLITKKSKPVPVSAKHGVYRCIALDNGMFLEETYNSFRILKSREVDACHLDKVPNASVYKIDLYSAGSGGTKYAAYLPQNNDSRSSTFTMADAVNYAKTGNITFANKMGNFGSTDMPYDLTDDNIRFAIKDEHIIQTAFSGSGSKGADATYTYKSPARAVCAALVHGSDKAYEKMKNARVDYNNAQKTYDESYKAYDKQVDKLKKDIAGYQAQIEQNKTNKTGYAKYIEKLNNYISAMDSMPNIYSTLTSSSSTYASRREAYIALSTAAGKDAPEFGLYEVYQKNSFMNRDQYNNIAKKQADIKENFQSIKKWLNNDEIHKRSANDEADPTKKRNATEAELFEDLSQSTENKKLLEEMKTYASESASDARSGVTTLTNAIKDMDKKNTELDEKIAKKDKEIKSKYTQRDNDTNLKDLANKRDTLKDEYAERIKVYDAMLNSAGDIKPRPSVYDDKKGWRIDSDDEYKTPETLKQISDYCRYSEDTESTHEFYTNSDYGWYDPANPEKLAIEPYETHDSVKQLGGPGGAGKYMQLDYVLFYGTAEQNRYSGITYPFVKHIGTLYGNVGNNGYELVACTSLNLSSSTCSPGTVPNAGAADSGMSWSTVEIGNQIKHIGRAKDGKYVEKFMAYHIPNFGDNKHYITVQQATDSVNSSAVGATGGKGGVVGYIDGKKTYTPGIYTENLAWQTFKGEDQDSAAKGKDAKIGAPLSRANRYELKKTEEVITQEPRIDQSSTTWTKSYSMGQAGSPGKHEHFQVSSMGTRCEMTIPHGGIVFDIMELSREAENQGLNVANYLSTKRTEYENGLNAKITCFNSEDQEVFSRVAKGGSYNITPTAWNNPFHWRKGVTSHSVEPMQPEPTPIPRVSRWAKVFHTGMAQLNNIAFGGQGTGFTDYCVVPKGTYHFQAYRLRSVAGGSWTETPIGTPFDKSYDGKKGGNFDCYQDNAGEGSYMGAKVFDESRMTAEESANYSIANPTQGGGGAIVVMW